MARVNVDESIFLDARFTELAMILSSRALAIGELVLAWRIAIMYYAKHNSYIPLSVWKKQKLSDSIITVGLAEVRDDFVYVRGTEKHADWLKKLQISGKKGGLAKSKRKAEIIEENSKQMLEYPKPFEPSLLLNINTKTVSPFRLTQLDVPPVETPDQIDPLVKIWEQHRGKLPSVKKLTASRKRKCVLRWKEGTAGEWEEAVRKLAASDFCNGKNENGWRASFDFLLRPDTLAKALEGVYDNKKSNMPQIKIMEFTQK